MDSEQVLALPRIRFEDRQGLPDAPGLYFAIVNGDQVAYIGSARASIRRRWVSHHRRYRLQKLGAIEIAYCPVGDADDLAAAEKDAIISMQPCLNVFHVKGAYDRERRYFSEQLDALKRPKPGPKPRRQQPAP